MMDLWSFALWKESTGISVFKNQTKPPNKLVTEYGSKSVFSLWLNCQYSKRLTVFRAAYFRGLLSIAASCCFAPCVQVVEYGLFVKNYKVEVYLLELKLCESSDPDNVISCHFSKADTVGK